MAAGWGYTITMPTGTGQGQDRWKPGFTMVDAGPAPCAASSATVAPAPAKQPPSAGSGQRQREAQGVEIFPARPHHLDGTLRQQRLAAGTAQAADEIRAPDGVVSRVSRNRRGWGRRHIERVPGTPPSSRTIVPGHPTEPLGHGFLGHGRNVTDASASAEDVAKDFNITSCASGCAVVAAGRDASPAGATSSRARRNTT